MLSISPDTCHSTWIFPSVSGALRLTSSVEPWRTLSLFQPTFVVMLPLHVAFAVNVRFVITIGNGSMNTIGAWSWNPPRSAAPLATGTTCELDCGAATAEFASTMAARPAMESTSRARDFFENDIGCLPFT